MPGLSIKLGGAEELAASIACAMRYHDPMKDRVRRGRKA
jgi:hypothetical protein